MSEITTQPPSLVEKFAGRFGVEPAKFMATLRSTAFKQSNGSAPTNEQMMALLVVADQYGLNPWTKEIYAFPDRNSGIIPVVGVDGWSRIINSNPNFDGMEFRYSENTIDDLEGQIHPAPEWCECVIYRKDRSHPTVVREYLDEVYQPPRKGYSGPWQTHTRRFLRHKTMIQCSRLAFGFVGIYDQDEAERIIEAEVVEVVRTAPELSTHDDEQKATFDKLIEDQNDLGMLVFLSDKDHGVQASLFNSFEKGTVTKYKEIVRKMQANGNDEAKKTVEALNDFVASNDDSGMLETMQELSAEEQEFLLYKMPRHSADIVREVMNNG